MLTLKRMYHARTGEPLAGFWILNATGKRVAVGATGCYVRILADRYAADGDLVNKVAELAGLRPTTVNRQPVGQETGSLADRGVGYCPCR